MSTIPEPWKSFFTEIDESLETETHLEILGGFVITLIYGAPRTTADVDVVSITPNTETGKLIELAGEGSPLHKKHGIYLDRVGIAVLPEDYEDRITEIFAGEFQFLKLYALDPYDIALAKIERNIDRDREDVKFLAEVRSVRFGNFKRKIFQRTASRTRHSRKRRFNAPALDRNDRRRKKRK